MLKFCSLFSGSSGNCIFVGNEETNILIDAGVSGKKIEKALNEIGESGSSLSAILVTHEHQDHINGVGILSRRFKIPVYANEKTWEAIDREKLLGKMPAENKRVVSAGDTVSVGSMRIKSCRISHDAADPVCYTISSEGHKVGIATDMGFVSDEIRTILRGCELALVEANHDVEMLKAGKYPYQLKRRILSDSGHLSNESAAELVAMLAKHGTKRFILGHLSEENNYPRLAYEAVNSVLKIKGFDTEKDIFLRVAERDCPGDVILL